MLSNIGRRFVNAVVKFIFKSCWPFGGPRQVFDIPPSRLEVTEHRILDWVCCGCQEENLGKFPPSVSAPAQYGLRLQTMGVLFNNAYNIPRNKV